MNQFDKRKSDMHVAIRVDGGPDIGYGHLIRSNSLIAEILTRGHGVSIATTTPHSARSVIPQAVEITELPTRGDPAPFVDWLDTNHPDVVFTDSYAADSEYQRTIRDQFPLAVLQDDNRHAVCADLFVNGNLYACKLDFEFIGNEPNVCLGTDYVLLRREIRNRAKDDPPWREQPERALVTMGGSDIANLTPTVLRSFDGFDIHVDAIVGPGFSEAQEHSVRAVSDEISPDVDVVRNPDDLAKRMFQADFAVSTSSTTTYELLALGTPIISVPVAKNQERIAEALREHDLAVVLQPSGEIAGLQRSINAYLKDGSLRMNRQKTGRKLVDGMGTNRVANEVIGIASR